MAPLAPVAPARPGRGEAVLSTWHWLLDDGSLQDGEPFLAGTAPRPRALLSAATATAVGVGEGDLLTVASATGRISLPVAVTEMADHVVWLPTCSPGSAVRASLGVDAGAVVTITKGGAA
jgi:NADH-quinone oxidoreductase subunit G